MKKSIIIVCCTILLTSCATQKKVKRKDLVKIDNGLNAVFTNNDTSNPDKTLTSLFDMNLQKDNQVTVNFNKNGECTISYKDLMGNIRYRLFKGKLKRKCFEIYVEKMRSGFPFTVQLTRIERIRIMIAKDSTLVVDKYVNRSGSLFLMGAGYAGTTHFQFKPIKIN